MPHRFKQIALFLPPTPGYLADVLAGVVEHAAVAGDWIVELCPSFDVARNATRWWRPDGILVYADGGNWAPLVRRLGVPTVQVGGAPLADVPRVITDNVAIGQLAARHFVERGYRHFGYVGYDTFNWARERGQVYGDALAAAGHACHRYGGDQATIHAHSVEGPLAAWVAALPKPVGVFACNDHAAMLLGRACASARVDVPDDVAILGVDNNPVECALTTPPLSSIMGSARRIGYQASALLDQLLRGEPAPRESLHVAPAGVTVRGSTDIYASDDPDLLAALRYIRDHAHEPIEVGDVARESIVNRRMLERRFRAVLGRSPREQILLAHIERAKELLMNTDRSMLDVALCSGFPSSSKFSTVFRRETALTPMAFRRLYGQRKRDDASWQAAPARGTSDS